MEALAAKKAELKKAFAEELQAHPERYAGDYASMAEAVAGSRAYYKGKPVPFSYEPYFIDEEEEQALFALGRMMTQVAKKAIAAYRQDAAVRKLFQFPRWIEELILTENPLNGVIPMARWDIFNHGQGEAVFCELNTDGSSAMNEDNELAAIWLDTAMAKTLGETYRLTYYDMFDPWVEAVERMYHRQGHTGKPNVLIMDFLDSATTYEFERFREAFERAGCPCRIGDVRRLRFDGEKLYDEDFPVDVIYRRMVTFELIERPEGTEAFQAAYRAQKVLTVGPLSTQVVHNKTFFALLFHPTLRGYYTPEELAWIDRHIPETHLLDEGNYRTFLKNRASWILKPVDRNASQGVVAGKAVTDEAWEAHLRSAVQEAGYLVQQFVAPPWETYWRYENGSWQSYRYSHVMGLFQFDEEPAGFYTRIGPGPVISGEEGDFSIPHIKGERR